MAATIGAVLAAAVAQHPTRPLLTFYDDGTGDRTELSGVTLDNWVAKTANLLVDGAGLAEGGIALVDLPPHWQTAAVLLGCWSAGVVVELPSDGSARQGAEVAFAAQPRAAAYTGVADEVYGLALAPMAAPMRDAPAGVADYVVQVRGFGDRFAAPRPITPDDQAAILGGVDTPTHAELLDRARAAGLKPGDRVLVDAGAHPDPVDWLLAALVAGASTVLCANLDRDRLAARVAAEHVTVVRAP
jgi:uncharacterized protein (TIGR03089 family)